MSRCCAISSASRASAHLGMGVDAAMLDKHRAGRKRGLSVGAKAMKMPWSRSFQGRLSLLLTTGCAFFRADHTHLRRSGLACHGKGGIGDPPTIGGTALLVGDRDHGLADGIERFWREIQGFDPAGGPVSERPANAPDAAPPACRQRCARPARKAAAAWSGCSLGRYRQTKVSPSCQGSLKVFCFQARSGMKPERSPGISIPVTDPQTQTSCAILQRVDAQLQRHLIEETIAGKLSAPGAH